MNIVLNWVNSSFSIPVWQGRVHISCPYLAPDPYCQNQDSCVFTCYSPNKISRDFSWHCSVSTHFWKTSSVGDQYIAAKTHFINEICLGKLPSLHIQTLLAGRTVFCAPKLHRSTKFNFFFGPTNFNIWTLAVLFMLNSDIYTEFFYHARLQRCSGI